MSNPTETLPPLTDDLRPNLRRQSLWMTCFRSWLDAGRPSVLRGLLAGSPETLLREVDSLVWAVGNYVMQAYPENQQLEPWAIAEALQRMDTLNWEDEASEEELDREQDNPLTEEDDSKATALADAAHEEE
jgi:hypothetical protein